MPDADGTTALVVLVPEADAPYGGVRLRHDSSAPLGVTAHVTVLYPFVPEGTWTPSVDERLARALAGVAAFDASFRRTDRFGAAVLYLAPEPRERFDALLRTVFDAFPETPPYGGAHATVVPHLTLADDGDAAAFAEAEALVARTPPLASRVSAVTLLSLRSGRWAPRRAWPLG